MPMRVAQSMFTIALQRGDQAWIDQPDLSTWVPPRSPSDATSATDFFRSGLATTGDDKAEDGQRRIPDGPVDLIASHPPKGAQESERLPAIDLSSQQSSSQQSTSQRYSSVRRLHRGRGKGARKSRGGRRWIMSVGVITTVACGGYAWIQMEKRSTRSSLSHNDTADNPTGRTAASRKASDDRAGNQITGEKRADEKFAGGPTPTPTFPRPFGLQRERLSSSDPRPPRELTTIQSLMGAKRSTGGDASGELPLEGAIFGKLDTTLDAALIGGQLNDAETAGFTAVAAEEINPARDDGQEPTVELATDALPHPFDSVTLPPRADRTEVAIAWQGAKDTAQPRLEMPGRSDWTLLQDDQSETRWYLLVRDDVEEPLARMKASDAIAGDSSTWQWMFQWTETAAKYPTADALRNGRLRGENSIVYFRDPVRIDDSMLKWQLTGAVEFPLTAPPENQRTETEIRVEPRGKANEGSAPRVTWLSPAQRPSDPRDQWLIEIAADAESPVRVRIRFDVSLEKELRIEQTAIAMLDPMGTWFKLDRSTPASMAASVGIAMSNLHRFQAINEAQYDNAKTASQRAVLRDQREILDEREDQFEQFGERVEQLRELIHRIDRELRWSIIVESQWPESRQSIVITDPPPPIENTGDE
jgi:hypothetical protein